MPCHVQYPFQRPYTETLCVFPRLQHPKKAATPLEADYHQRIIMRFALKDKAQNAPMAAHQTFIRLTHIETSQEIVFVAEADAADQYKFDLVSAHTLGANCHQHYSPC